MDGINDSTRNSDRTRYMPRPLVALSLRRSRVRKKVAEYLFEIKPSGSYTSEISEKIDVAPTNVLGAIKGSGKRYKSEGSLLDLNIVEQIKSGKNDRTKYYRLTDFGIEIVENMKNTR